MLRIQLVAILTAGAGLAWAAGAWLNGYGVLAVIGWMLLVWSFVAAHAPEKSLTELIRESR